MYLQLTTKPFSLMAKVELMNHETYVGYSIIFSALAG